MTWKCTLSYHPLSSLPCSSHTLGNVLPQLQEGRKFCLFCSQLNSQGRNLPWWLKGYSSCLQCGRPGFHPWVGKIPWRRQWYPTPVFLPGESHGHRSLAGYSPRGCKESDTAEWLRLLTYLNSQQLELWLAHNRRSKIFVESWMNSRTEGSHPALRLDSKVSMSGKISV